MNRTISIRAEAETDLEEAFAWYEGRSRGLGIEFLRSFEARLSAIERNPLSSPHVHHHVRRALLRRFPFGLFYIVEDERIVVLGCLHAKRGPEQLGRRAPGGLR